MTNANRPSSSSAPAVGSTKETTPRQHYAPEQLSKLREGANPVPEFGEDFATVIERLLATIAHRDESLRLWRALVGGGSTVDPLSGFMVRLRAAVKLGFARGQTKTVLLEEDVARILGMLENPAAALEETRATGLRAEAIALMDKDWTDNRTTYALDLANTSRRHMMTLVDAGDLAGLIRRVAAGPRVSGKRDGFTRPTEREWRAIVTKVGGGK